MRVKNKTVCGIGINDYDGSIKIDGRAIKSYKIWMAMLGRCYSTKDKKYHQYGAKGVKVCDEWLYFSNFKKWFDENYRYDLVEQGIKIALDKDLMSDGSKIYSPTTCIFLPERANSFISTSELHKNNTSGYIGVYWFKRDNKWKAQITKCDTGKVTHLGYFDNIEDAHKSYQSARKIEVIKIKEYLKKLGYDESIVSRIK